MGDIDKILQEYQNGNIDLNGLKAYISSSPETAQYLAQQQSLREQGQKTAMRGDMLDFLTNVGMSAFALNQIGQANRMAGELTAPSVPSAPGLSPELTQGIYEAQRGVDYAPALEASRQGIEDAYSSNINQAAQASGGQAGAYQAMSQLANTERLKAQLGLAPIAQQVNMQNQSNLNQLIGQRADERQGQFYNQLQGAYMGQRQYENDVNAVGSLGQAGYSNLFQTLPFLAQGAGNLAGYGTRPPGQQSADPTLQDWYNQNVNDDWIDSQISSFDPDTQKYMKDVVERNRSINPYQKYYSSNSRLG
jgi:hypothetical protein